MTIISNLVLTFSLISLNSGERWYSATVIETDNSFKPIIPSNVIKNSNIEGSEQNFLHIVRPDVNRFNTEDSNRWRFMQRKSNKNVLKHESNFYSNGLQYVNDYGKTKKIKKRCPEACSKKGFKSNQTKTRFLEVFQVVSFENAPCTSSSGLEGICLHEYECQSSEGTAMGTCADGYGTCCVTLLPCDSSSSATVSWFTNPDYPLPSNNRLSCAVALSKASDDITQIRLDFSTFELLPPTAGTCHEDQFIVSGQNINNVIPILCGINTGQHFYVEVSESNGPIYLSVQTGNSENRLFSIKVTQLTSSDDLAAPPGCLQYFTEPKGFIESFNYRDRSEISIARTTSYLNNLNYAMCFGRAPGTCSVTYSNAGYLQITNFDNDGLPVIPPGQAGVEIFNCPSDWLLISATRLCGDRLNDGSIIQDFSLNAPITDSTAGPIVVWFRSDEGYVGKGFKIKYEQNLCAPN